MRPLALLVLLAALAGFPATAQVGHVSADPDSARLVTADITRFWDVVERATPATFPDLLQHDYLDAGTVGLQDFVPYRIESAAALAEAVRDRRDQYDAVRAFSLSAGSADRAVRAPLYALEHLYPEAVFPDVYVVVGRFTSAGTATERGLIIGAEMFRDADGLRGVVAHEVVHFQQRASGQYAAAEVAENVLAVAFLEGSADFVAELTSGIRGNAEAQAYGRAHEHEVWEAFREDMGGGDPAGWFYGDPPDERPSDVGYFVGYRIAEAYYARAVDKRAAIRDILTRPDFEGLVAESGYAP